MLFNDLNFVEKRLFINEIVVCFVQNSICLKEGEFLMKRKFITLLLTIATCLSVFVNFVYATEVDPLLILSSSGDVSFMTSVDTDARTKIGYNNAIISYKPDSSTNNYVLRFSVSNYKDLSADEQKTYMEYVLSSISQNRNLSTMSKNKLYNFVADQDTELTATLRYLKVDTKTDIAKAGYYLRPFNNAVGKALGVITILIFVFTSLSIVIDVAYLVLPGLQVMLSAGRKPNEKPLLVSPEAHKSMQISQSPGEERSQVLWIYLKRRVPQIFIISLCLLYLISGTFYDIIIYVIDSFRRAL